MKRFAISSGIMIIVFSGFPSAASFSQVWNGTTLELNDGNLGINGDYTAIYRADTETDRTHLRIRMGDEPSSDFEIGYTDWQNGQWQSNFNLDGSGNTFVRGSMHIGTGIATAQLHLTSDTDHAFHISRGNGLYGFRILRNAQQGRIFFQNTDDNNVAGTRILFDEGGPGWMNVILNPDGGNVGIGTTSPDTKLTVKGTIHTEEVKVDLSVPAPDYVFEKDYNLLPLAELEVYINQNKHLPEIPSAKEMEENGLNLKEMNLLLLKKVEELTLHLIEQQKLNAEQEKKIEFLMKGK